MRVFSKTRFCDPEVPEGESMNYVGWVKEKLGRLADKLLTPVRALWIKLKGPLTFKEKLLIL